MKTGMLWYDNDPKSNLETKVTRAGSYYLNKYGRRPNLAYVHPSMLAEKLQQAGGVEIRATRQVLPNHIWIGISEPEAVMQ